MITPSSTNRLRIIAQSTTILCASFLLSLAVASLFMLPNTSQAVVVPISCGLPHTLSTCLSINVSSPSLEIEMPSVSADGAYAYGANTVNVKTNAPAYNLALSTNSASTTSQRLQNSADASFIAPTTGALGSLSPLGSNTWGFTSAANPTATASIWSAVPTSSAPAVLVSSSSSTANDTTGTSTDVYYGVNINHEQTAGTYYATVLYTAMVMPFGAPSITTVSPTYGPATGGTVITITGTNFYDTLPTSGVQVGGTNCTAFTVNSPTSITCTVPAIPANTAGAKDVTVTTENGTATKTGGYTYIAPPTITSTSPNTGVVNTNTITITGTNFTGGGLGTYGIGDDSDYANCTIGSDTTATCTVAGIPEGGTGTVTIAITNAGGTTHTTFAYSQPYTAPVITAISNSISTAYGTTSGLIYVSTDRAAHCAWNINTDVVWGYAGVDFDSAYYGHVDHAATVNGLSGGYNVIYVRCLNIYDHSKTSPPSTAAVTISTTPPPPATTLGAMQALTNAACPTTRGTAYDVRNKQVYYVRNIAGLCWMESNLRYAGWGDNTYGDIKAVTLGTTTSFSSAYYYDPGGSQDYTNTAAVGGFYGYLYNWCATMGGQTDACSSAIYPSIDANISLCPAGWRTPTNSELNSLFSYYGTWLAVYAGRYTDGGLLYQGRLGGYWTSTPIAGMGSVSILSDDSLTDTMMSQGSKTDGRSLRCVR